MRSARPTGRFGVASLAAVVAAGGAWLGAACTDEESGQPPEPSVEIPDDGEPVEVLEVSDGDSFMVRRGDGNEARVRLLGVNAPERGECLADAARRALDDVLAAGPVVLERDISDRDEFGRLVRYVYAGDVFVNLELASRGLALTSSFPPDLAHQPELDAAQGVAQDARLGQWDPNACGPADSTEVAIVRTEGDPTGPDTIELNGEYIVVANTADEPVGLSGWVLRDSSSQNRFVFPAGFTLGSGAEVAIRTGSGTDTDDTLYWGLDHPVWDNAGDTAFIVDTNGNVVSFADLPPPD